MKTIYHNPTLGSQRFYASLKVDRIKKKEFLNSQLKARIDEMLANGVLYHLVGLEMTNKTAKVLFEHHSQQ